MTSASAEDKSQFPVGSEWLSTQPWLVNYFSYGKGAYALWQDGIQHCMKSRGFDYRAGRADLYLPDSVTNPLNERISSLYGYHTPPDPGALQTDGSTGAAFDAALGGANEVKGCGDLAWAYAYGGQFEKQTDEKIPALVNKFNDASQDFFTTDKYRKLVVRWAVCMSSAGYLYSDPKAANSAFNDRPTITSEELRVRAVDLECDKQTKLTESRSVYEQQKILDLDAQYAVQIHDLEQLSKQAYDDVVVRRRDLASQGSTVLGS